MRTSARPQILDQMSALSDSLRCRLLLILERQELTVSEVCSVLQLPQSTVSRHLKTLVDCGWIVSRPDGTRRLYRMATVEDAEESSPRPLWLLARDQLLETNFAEQDADRLRSVLQERRRRSEEFFAGVAGRWDHLRDELFGSRFQLAALMGLLDQDWVIGDLGCGRGSLSMAVAPFVANVIAVDGSEAMLEAASERLERHDNVELRRGELEALPIEAETLDAATLVLVLHHLADPARAIAEVARVLRPGGKLLLVDMLPHDRQEYRQTMGHVWLGFSQMQIGRLLTEAGFSPTRFLPLSPDPAAKGPALFAAVAVRGAARGSEDRP
jgi:ubiquinone/menaquinone biosynthesis C-methylase UbiE/DNA-binding MarR family transcriptional regulator